MAASLCHYQKKKKSSRVGVIDARFALTNTGSTGTHPSSTQLLDRAMKKGGETLGKATPRGHNQTCLKDGAKKKNLAASQLENICF